jgi:hypothetical protein
MVKSQVPSHRNMNALSWYCSRFFNIDLMNSTVSGVSIFMLGLDAIWKSRKDSVEICSEMYFPLLSVSSGLQKYCPTVLHVSALESRQ